MSFAFIARVLDAVAVAVFVGVGIVGLAALCRAVAVRALQRMMRGSP